MGDRSTRGVYPTRKTPGIWRADGSSIREQRELRVERLARDCPAWLVFVMRGADTRMTRQPAYFIRVTSFEFGMRKKVRSKINLKV
jgi:hypothetical protein